MSWVSDHLVRLVRLQANEEQAEMSLLSLMWRPVTVEQVMAEVDRRAAVYAQAWQERPDRSPLGETPRCAALRSVAEDVARGRLG